MPETTSSSTLQPNEDFVPALPENTGYHYDSKDQFRNNRPSRTRPKSPVSKNQHEEQYSTITNNIATHPTPENPVRVSRMPSTLDDFDVIATIGTGSYGTCKKIKRKKDGKVMVWKEMEYGSMTESEKQMLVSEVNLLRELRHQHIVRYYDRIIDRTKAVIYIIMEYCQGGDLASIISRNRKDGTRVAEDFAWKILIQTTLALKECHRRKNGKAVLHRDLKPANVFLDAEANVKLGDFGLARVLQHEYSLAQTYVGTPYYMSPELVNNQSYNEKSDIWSLGCMLYELCALAPPFTATNEAELKRKIRIGDFPRIPSQYSLELDMVIRRMIQVEVSRRPSIDAVLSDSVVRRKQDSLNRKNGNVENIKAPSSSGERMSGSGDKETVMPKSEDLSAKMRQLELKEKELESRERSLAIREKLAEDKLKRAMEIMEQCHCKDDSSSISDCVSPRLSHLSPRADVETPHSCLSKGRANDISPKKQVTFDTFLHGKENLRRKFGLGLGMRRDSGLYTGNAFDKDNYRNYLYRAHEATGLTGLGSRESGAKYTPRNFGLLHFR